MRSFRHIAKLIRDKRLSHKNSYSQSELSSLLGYKNGQFISNVERGLCSIPLKMLKKVCDILDIEQAEFREVLLKDYENTLDSYFTSQSDSSPEPIKQEEPTEKEKLAALYLKS